jgi:hypothetical protein
MNQPKRLRLFLQLHLDLLDAPAWRATSAAGRLLYVTLRRRHNSKHNNNGDIFISQREAAEELGFTRPTVAKSFRELEYHGFIVMTSPGCLGVEAIDIRRARLALFGRADRMRRAGREERQQEREREGWIGADRKSCETGVHNCLSPFRSAPRSRRRHRGNYVK